MGQRRAKTRSDGYDLHDLRVASVAVILFLVGSCTHPGPVRSDTPRKFVASPVQIPVHTDEGDLRLQGAVFWIDGVPRPPNDILRGRMSFA